MGKKENKNESDIVAINNKLYSKTFWVTLLIKQNRWHRHGVLIHTLKVVYQVCKAKDYKFLATAFFHDQIVKNWPILSDWSKDMIRYHYLIRDRRNSKKRGHLKRLARLDAAWDKLSPEFIKDLEQFLIYDDKGKK